MASVTCSATLNQLAAFHLAQDEAKRDGVEAHLLGCRDCLAHYLEMKRAFDLAAVSTALPSPAIRRELRAHFRAHLVPYLFAGLAAAATVFAVLHVTPRLEPAEPRVAVDSASPIARNLNTL